MKFKYRALLHSITWDFWTNAGISARGRVAAHFSTNFVTSVSKQRSFIVHHLCSSHLPRLQLSFVFKALHAFTPSCISLLGNMNPPPSFSSLFRHFTFVPLPTSPMYHNSVPNTSSLFVPSSFASWPPTSSSHRLLVPCHSSFVTSWSSRLFSLLYY